MENSLLRLLALDRLSSAFGEGEIADLIARNAPLVRELMSLEAGRMPSPDVREPGGDLPPEARDLVTDLLNATDRWLSRVNAAEQPVDLLQNQIHIGRHLLHRVIDGGQMSPIGSCFVSLVDLDSNGVGTFRERFLLNSEGRDAWLDGTLNVRCVDLYNSGNGSSLVLATEESAATDFRKELASMTPAWMITLTYRYCEPPSEKQLAEWAAKAKAQDEAAKREGTPTIPRKLFAVAGAVGTGWLLRETPISAPVGQVIDHWRLSSDYSPPSKGESLQLTPHGDQSNPFKTFTEKCKDLKAGPGTAYVRTQYYIERI